MTTKIETVTVGSNGKTRVTLIALSFFLVVIILLVAAAGYALLGNNSKPAILTQELSEPLSGATTARIEINRYSGDLAIDRQPGGEKVLASGNLPYLDTQAITRSVNTTRNPATLTLKTNAAGRSQFRLPWVACTDDTRWQIHLNPAVASDITARSGGGNANLDLTGLIVTRVYAELGGGNLSLTLPDKTANLNATAKTGAGNVDVDLGNNLTGSNTIIAGSGAGNVTVRLPGNIPARIHASSGMGSVIVDPRFSKVDDKTYQSDDYASAANKVDLTLNSGAGNVSVSVK